MTASETRAPEVFMRAVTALRAVRARREILLEELAPPQRLAPHAFALGASVLRGDDEVATGRFVLLHDPAGHPAWEGTTRVVTYAAAQLEPDMAGDPMLAAVGWSWLIDALEAHGARWTAAGGTVTQTTSARFGELAGPAESADLELRASWTPLTDGVDDHDDIGLHLESWCTLLASTAGLPPPGVTLLTTPAPRQDDIR